MNRLSRTMGMMAGLALFGSCTEDDADAAAEDVGPVGDASITTPCTDMPADPQEVPAATLARFEAAWSTGFAASGTWVESDQEAISWSHPVAGSSAALTLGLDPVSGSGWTWFALDSEDCTLRLGQTVAVTVSTADGALAEAFEGRLSEDEAGVLSLSAQVDLANLTGSLHTATVEPAGAIRVLARFDLQLSAASLDGTLTGFAEYSEEGGQVVHVLQFSMAAW